MARFLSSPQASVHGPVAAWSLGVQPALTSPSPSPSPCRVCRPGRLPAPVLQRPGPAHEGGGHVWMLPACVCRELPVVGAKTPVPRGYILKSAAGGGQGWQGTSMVRIAGKPPGRVPLLICAAQPPQGNRRPCGPRGWAVPHQTSGFHLMLSKNDESDTLWGCGTVAGIALPPPTHRDFSLCPISLSSRSWVRVS